MRKISRRSFLSAAAVCGAAAARGGSSASSAVASSVASSTAASVSAAADGQKYTVGICQLVEHAALDAATQGFEDALTGAKLTGAGVVTDGNITTARGLGYALDLGIELASLLVDRPVALQVKDSIQYDQV